MWFKVVVSTKMNDFEWHNFVVELYPFGMYLHLNQGISLKKATNKHYQRVAYDILKDEYLNFIKEHGYIPDYVDEWYEGFLSELFVDDKFKLELEKPENDKEKM